MIRSTAAYAIMFSVYEKQLASYATTHDRPFGDVPLLAAAWFGVFAGVQGVLVGYLFANVKNVMQVSVG